LFNSIANDSLKEARFIVASIHRAAHKNNLEQWRKESGSWDMIIVDECHHCSDWAEDGSNPLKQMRLVRDLVGKRLSPDGRLVLMSGTPHQGKEVKFRNLLRLLSDEGYKSSTGSLESVAGRVVYRTKEDVQDWDGEPLFSRRKINEPTLLTLGDEYHSWMNTIERVFVDSDAGPAAWRKAQALQWAASSPKAGLAYLARLALRSGFDFDQAPVLWDVASSLRPYRHVPAGAPVEAVWALLEKQSTQAATDDEDVDEVNTPLPVDSAALEEALRGGLALMDSGAMQTKLEPLVRWIEDESPSKFVVFASPIETVDEIRLGLERILGEVGVVSITGSMKPHERRKQMQAFREEGVRVLVSSKAGSEGINLQVAHRLVHFDVPWNPMELEQRVGRVHRYGSVQTVIVDTLVVENSKEAKMLRRCRARLAQIVEQLFGPQESSEKFEMMYSRVMTQVSGEELAKLMVAEGFQSQSEERLDELVQAGFEGWKASDDAMRKGSSASVVEIPDGGEAKESDMEELYELLGAQQMAGWHRVSLVEAADGERREVLQPARVWEFPAEGPDVRRVADRVSSLTVRGPSGFQGYVERAGLNLPGVAAKLRELVGGANPDVGRSPRAVGFCDGVGAARIPESDWNAWIRDSRMDDATWRKGGVLLAWAVRLLHRGTRTQTWSGVQTWLAPPDASTGQWLPASCSAELFRLLWRHRRRQNLQLPPHRRAHAAGFNLTGLKEQARRLPREVLRSIPEFEVSTHDFEIVPISALTIEPMREIAASEVEESDAADEAYLALDSTHRPGPDFLEKVMTALAEVPSSSSPGHESVYVLLLVDPSLLASTDPSEHMRAFGVYVGTTKQDVLDRYEQHRDPTAFLRASSLTWEGVEPVGVFRLEERFRNISSESASLLEADVAAALRDQELRVLGGH